MKNPRRVSTNSPIASPGCHRRQPHGQSSRDIDSTDVFAAGINVSVAKRFESTECARWRSERIERESHGAARRRACARRGSGRGARLGTADRPSSSRSARSSPTIGRRSAAPGTRPRRVAPGGRGLGRAHDAHARVLGGRGDYSWKSRELAFGAAEPREERRSNPTETPRNRGIVQPRSARRCFSTH